MSRHICSLFSPNLLYFEIRLDFRTLIGTYRYLLRKMYNILNEKLETKFLEISVKLTFSERVLKYFN